MRSKLRAHYVSGVVIAAVGIAVAAHAQEFKTPKVGGGSFPTSIAQVNGIFAKYGLQIEIPRSAAGGSEEVRRGLASGELDLAGYGVDNAIAMVENAGVDIILLVAATDYTPTELVAQREIKGLADLRGKTVLVDAPNTQNALALKKILSGAGLSAATDYVMKEAGGTWARVAAMLQHNEFAATMAAGQTAVQARQGGLVSLATTANIFGPTLRWIMHPANKEKVIDTVVKQAKLSRDLAGQIYEIDMGPNGLAKDAAIDVQRFANVLKFRAEVEGSWGGKAPPPDRYYDAIYHAKALALINANTAK